MRYTFDFNQSNDTAIVNSYANQNILFESVTFNIKQLPEHCKEAVKKAVNHTDKNGYVNEKAYKASQFVCEQAFGIDFERRLVDDNRFKNGRTYLFEYDDDILTNIYVTFLFQDDNYYVLFESSSEIGDEVPKRILYKI